MNKINIGYIHIQMRIEDQVRKPMNKTISLSPLYYLFDLYFHSPKFSSLIKNRESIMVNSLKEVMKVFVEFKNLKNKI